MKVMENARVTYLAYSLTHSSSLSIFHYLFCSPGTPVFLSTYPPSRATSESPRLSKGRLALSCHRTLCWKSSSRRVSLRFIRYLKITSNRITMNNIIFFEVKIRSASTATRPSPPYSFHDELNLYVIGLFLFNCTVLRSLHSKKEKIHSRALDKKKNSTRT